MQLSQGFQLNTINPNAMILNSTVAIRIPDDVFNCQSALAIYNAMKMRAAQSLTFGPYQIHGEVATRTLEGYPLPQSVDTGLVPLHFCRR